MAEAYECDRCNESRTGSPHTRIEVGDGVPRYRPRGYDRPVEEGDTITNTAEMYDICPVCRSAFEAWFEGGE